ncbi:MAG TPA: Crp/Fnr family transcriptional regulator [Terriglobales bacterium]|nr:Crp/Fnr family transcriptional regulator [Terriglobales bacterium]
MAAHAIKVNAVPQSGQMFPELPSEISQALDEVAFTTTYPSGAVLFVEEQAPRGIFIVRRGRVKLSVSGSDGKVLILRIAEPGELLGVSAAVSARGYEATAETQGPCEVSFIRQADLQRLMRVHRELPLWVAQQLSRDYDATCREIRHLVLSESATEKLARLLVDWLDQNEEARNPGRMKFTLTHEEIGQMIGTSRETVTRVLGGFKRRRLIQQNGATLVIPNRDALESLISA